MKLDGSLILKAQDNIYCGEKLIKFKLVEEIHIKFCFLSTREQVPFDISHFVISGFVHTLSSKQRTVHNFQRKSWQLYAWRPHENETKYSRNLKFYLICTKRWKKHWKVERETAKCSCWHFLCATLFLSS